MKISKKAKTLFADAESQVEIIDNEDKKLREKHLEILALAHEIMARSKSRAESNDSLDPGLIEEWNRDGGSMPIPNFVHPSSSEKSMTLAASEEVRSSNISESHIKSISSYDELYKELRQYENGGELSYRREETVIHFPAVLLKSNRSALLISYGPVVQQPQSDTLPPNNDSTLRITPGARASTWGELDFKRDEKIQEYGSFIQPLRTLESGASISIASKGSYNSSNCGAQQNPPSSPYMENVPLPEISSTPRFEVKGTSENESIENRDQSHLRVITDGAQNGSGSNGLIGHGGYVSHSLTNTESFDDTSPYDRERSPLSRHYYSDPRFLSISNDQILNEIEKLKSEHSKMMNLLERSRQKKYTKQKVLAESLKGSPSFFLESDSSGGDSPVTVIPRNGSLPGSTGVSPYTDTITSQSPPQILDRGMGSTVEDFNRVRPIGVKDGYANTETGHSFIKQNVIKSSERTSTVSTNTDSETKELYSKSVDSSSQTSNVKVVDKCTGGKQTKMSSGYQSEDVVAGDSNTSFIQGPRGFMPTTKKSQPHGEESNPNTTDLHIQDIGKYKGQQSDQILDTSRDITINDDSSSTNSRASTLSPLTLQTIWDDDSDSAFSVSSLNTGRPMVSTGVEVSVDNLDDYTQTDFVRLVNGSTDSIVDSVDQMNSSQSSDKDSMSTLHRQLDQLHKERIEIIELMSLNYLPTSLTIELLEAKLNYCIGQTDYLLSNLEDAWSREEMKPKQSKTLIKVTKEYLEEYKTQLNRSKKDIESCLETHDRKKGGVRGRRKTKGTDLGSMRRRAEIEAFKLERLREQYRHEREKVKNPLKHHLSGSVESLSPNSSLDGHSNKSMTPTQRREYLVSLRREIVNHSTRGHSLSPHSSQSSASGRTLRSTSCSPTRTDSLVYHVPDLRLRRSFPSSDGRYHHCTTGEETTLGESLKNLSTDLRTNVMASYSSQHLHPDRLIEESNEIRRQNQIQIEKAQEVLRELDERRQRTHRSQTEAKHQRLYLPPQAHSTSEHKLSAVKKSHLSNSSKFMEYARDYLVRGQHRHHTSPTQNMSGLNQSPSRYTHMTSHHGLSQSPSRISHMTSQYGLSLSPSRYTHMTSHHGLSQSPSRISHMTSHHGLSQSPSRISHMTSHHECPHGHSSISSGSWSLNSSVNQQPSMNSSFYCPHDSSSSSYSSSLSPSRPQARLSKSFAACPHSSSPLSATSTLYRSWSANSATSTSCPHEPSIHFQPLIANYSSAAETNNKMSPYSSPSNTQGSSLSMTKTDPIKSQTVAKTSEAAVSGGVTVP
uniref:Uncharacterized protein n=1 Tax=Biomphalaria glabrata TaxID=6526 RepID=A0A2C9LEC9_BIOGL